MGSKDFASKEHLQQVAALVTAAYIKMERDRDIHAEMMKAAEDHKSWLKDKENKVERSTDS